MFGSVVGLHSSCQTEVHGKLLLGGDFAGSCKARSCLDGSQSFDCAEGLQGGTRFSQVGTLFAEDPVMDVV